MKGYVLKEFLILCEIQGLLQVKAPLLKLEDELALLWESIVNTPLPNEDIHSGEDENGCSAEEEADVSLSCFYNIATPNASFLNIDLNNKTSTKSSPCESEEVSSAVDNGSGDANCQVEVDSSFNYSLPEVHTSLSDHILERDTSNSPVLSPVSVNNDSSQILSLDDYVTVRNENDNIRELEEQIICDSEEKSGRHRKSAVEEQNNEEDSFFEHSLSDIRVNLSHQLSATNQSPLSAMHNSSFDDHEAAKSDDSGKDDDDDEKLEKLFSDMKIRSEKKKYIPSRKSLCEFIVSDSEEAIVISDGEEENYPPPQTPVFRTPYSTPAFRTPYGTPCTPNSGIVFWGSPYDERKQHVRKVPRKKAVMDRSPLIQRVTPSGHCVKPVATPSSHKYFPRFKNDMLKELCQLFNKTVFGGKLTDVEVVWSKKLRTTAGLCQYQGLVVSRSARIELSTKVCDSYDRLRDTLLHEMCHAACWIIDGNKAAGHGPLWKQWADKAQTQHPGLHPVTRCHDYQIVYKYTYKCVRCDFKMGRHSKSVKLQTARCPRCISELELVPRLKSDGTPATDRKLNRYTKFIKENYSTVKEASPYRTHTQVLEKINQLYHSVKDSLPS